MFITQFVYQSIVTYVNGNVTYKFSVFYAEGHDLAKLCKSKRIPYGYMLGKPSKFANIYIV